MLDVMRGMEAPRYRAEVLAVATPRMPGTLRARAESEARRAAQAVEPRTPRDRAEERLLLFPVLDPGERQARLQEIRALLPALDNAYEVARETIAALPWLTPAESTTWLDDALASAGSDVKYGERAQALLAPHLNAPQIEAMVEEYVYASEVEQDLVAAVASRLAELGRADAALDFLEAHGRSTALRSGLRDVIPHLPLTAVPRVDALVERLDWLPSRHELLASLCGRLAALGAVSEALTRARSLRETATSPPTMSSVTALAVVRPHLPSDGSAAIIDEELAAGLSALERSERTKLIRRLAPTLAALPPLQLEALWRRELELLRERPRTELLETLYALAPMIEAISGRAGVAQVFHAVRQVTAWWP